MPSSRESILPKSSSQSRSVPRSTGRKIRSVFPATLVRYLLVLPEGIMITKLGSTDFFLNFQRFRCQIVLMMAQDPVAQEPVAQKPDWPPCQQERMKKNKQPWFCILNRKQIRVLVRLQQNREPSLTTRPIGLPVS